MHSCVNFVFIGLRETELLKEFFIMASTPFLPKGGKSQRTAKLWCAEKKYMTCTNFLVLHHPLFHNFWRADQICPGIASHGLLPVAKQPLLLQPCPVRCCAFKAYSNFLTLNLQSTWKQACRMC